MVRQGLVFFATFLGSLAALPAPGLQGFFEPCENRFVESNACRTKVVEQLLWPQGLERVKAASLLVSTPEQSPPEWILVLHPIGPGGGSVELRSLSESVSARGVKATCENRGFDGIEVESRKKRLRRALLERILDVMYRGTQRGLRTGAGLDRKPVGDGYVVFAGLPTLLSYFIHPDGSRVCANIVEESRADAWPPAVEVTPYLLQIRDLLRDYVANSDPEKDSFLERLENGVGELEGHLEPRGGSEEGDTMAPETSE